MKRRSNEEWHHAILVRELSYKEIMKYEVRRKHKWHALHGLIHYHNLLFMTYFFHIPLSFTTTIWEYLNILIYKYPNNKVYYFYFSMDFHVAIVCNFIFFNLVIILNVIEPYFITINYANFEKIEFNKFASLACSITLIVYKSFVIFYRIFSCSLYLLVHYLFFIISWR